MSINSVTSFGNYQSVIIERNVNITITTKTIKVADNVYKTNNIVSFGEGSIEIGRIDWIFIVLTFAIGVSTLAVDKLFIGWTFIIFSFLGQAWNIYKPKHYGLLLVLNSGDKHLFITDDIQGRRNVVAEVHQLIESDKENMTYQVTVENSRIIGNLDVIEEVHQLIESDKENMTYQIKVENSRIIGNLVAGDVEGNLSSVMGDQIKGDKVGHDKIEGNKLTENRDRDSR